MFVLMTWHEAYRNFLGRVRADYDASEADLITSWIFESRTGLGRADVIRKKDEQLPQSLLQELEQAFARIEAHEPVQYVTGKVLFHEMEFRVNPSVLIPRPETEEMLECLFKFSIPAGAKMLDIGTGSGCLAVTIKKNRPDAQVTAIDISQQALETAAINAKDNGVDLNFREMDFLNESCWPQLGIFDFIISNPPYVPISEKESLAPHVRDREPHAALFPPGNDPLIFYRKISLFGKSHLAHNGRMIMELHSPLAKQTKEIFESAGYMAEIKKDIFGNERILVVTRCR